jgi:hypothetical protein
LTLAVQYLSDNDVYWISNSENNKGPVGSIALSVFKFSLRNSEIETFGSGPEGSAFISYVTSIDTYETIVNRLVQFVGPIPSGKGKGKLVVIFNKELHILSPTKEEGIQSTDGQ